MLDRRGFVVGALTILAAPLIAAAQAGKVYRIGRVFLGSPGPEVMSFVDAFREGLRQHGYLEGRNVAFEFRWAHGKADRLDELTVELVRVGVDIIMAGTSHTAHAAKRATTTIPIVLVGPDPLSTGLVASLARPGGNITGVTALPGPALAGKYLQLLQEAAPSVSRVAVLWNQDSHMQPLMVREAQSAATALGLKLQPVGVRDTGDFDRAFAAMSKERAEGLVVLPDPVTFAHRRRLAELALSHRLPGLFSHSEAAHAGALVVYAASLIEVARRGGSYADRILRGTKPGDLPVEQPTKFELGINLKTARALGLTIPPSLLLRAAYVVE